MKKFFFSLFILFVTNLAFAQVPQGIPYQSAMRNSSGAILANQNISMRFSIHDSALNGTIVYQETHNPTTNAMGMVSLTIGQGNAITGTFATVNWAQHAKFLQVEMDPAGGMSYVDLGTQQMMSVPYALSAGNGLPNGNLGEMLYNNGGSWMPVTPGVTGQHLIYCDGVPRWGGCPVSLTTAPITLIANSSATTGGTITNNNGSPTISKGVCWSTSPNPTLSDNFTTNGTGDGSFVSNIIGLTAGTTYYVRAYGTNSIGTGYGNQLSFTTTNVPLAVGQIHQGGIIGYILQPGDPGYIPGEVHGLVIAASDQGVCTWGCNGVAIPGADGTAIGTGMQNTIDIVNGCSTSGIAARLCSDLVLNGYSDWYLPSKDELNKLYINQSSIPGFINNFYWSSSENNTLNAWFLFPGTGMNCCGDRANTARARAVRSF